MHKLLKFIMLFLIFFNAIGNDYAQKKEGKAKVDSLLLELPKIKDDTNKVNIMNGISYGYSSFNIKEGITYGQQALELATKLGWAKGIANANQSLGTNCYYNFDLANALKYYSTALKKNEEIDNKKGEASVTGNIGLVYTDRGDYAMALAYYMKALKMNEAIGDKKGISIVTANIGMVYNIQSDYPKALEYDFKALEMAEKMGNRQFAGTITGNIGLVYSNQKDYTKALEYDLKALKINEEVGNKGGQAKVLGNMANVYNFQSNYTKALEYNFKALTIHEEMGNKDGISRVTGNIGLVYNDLHDHPRALQYYYKALKMDEELGNKQSIANVNSNIGYSYMMLVEDTVAPSDQYIKQVDLPGENNATGEKIEQPINIPSNKSLRLHIAIDYLQRALDSATSMHLLRITQFCNEYLSRAYKLKGDYKHAIDYYQNYIIIRDSLYSKENEKKVMKQQMDYDYDKKEMAAKSEQEKKDIIQRHVRYSGLAGITGLFVFSVIVYRQRNRVKKEKAKVEVEKGRSEELLLNILPEEVAAELKEKGSAAAKHYEHVTVMFTDFVNFTEAGEKMSPQALIDELHTCFKTFDEITARHNIEKIKTIGDAYLAVCGLPMADPKHAENIVNAAIEINTFMISRYDKLGNSTFEMRIGVHSGNVVAGIVGVKKFAYDIWGDAVNTAARMEQHSEAGKINISQTTYELVKDKFNCTCRGEIEAKNKGKMKMYYVTPMAAGLKLTG